MKTILLILFRTVTTRELSLLVLLLLALCLPAPASAEYQPIFHITGENPTSYIGSKISNCGDQNGDGADELLLSNHDPEKEVFLFYSGEYLDTIPDLIFSQPNTVTLGAITYGENIRSLDYGSILVCHNYYDISRIYLYDCGAELDTLYDMIFLGESYADGFGLKIATGDVNGDGWNDIVTSAVNFGPWEEDWGKLYVFYGGADMDNIPDFTITAMYNNFGDGLGSGLACGDVNGDGFADILATTASPRKAWLFYGGSEPDSIPDWSYSAPSPDYLITHCTIAPDLTGDEYADIILAPATSPSAYVFFGGEIVSNTPDQNINVTCGSITYTGNLNGDEYGDLIGKSHTYNLVRPLYGSTAGINPGEIIDTDGSPIAVGNCGDVNGDGFDDIGYSTGYPEYYGSMIVYADTTLSSVNREQITENRSFELLPNYPNPFNATTTIPFTLDRAGKVELNIYDILGRSVRVQQAAPLQGWYPAGSHQIVWEAEGMASGMYFVRLETVNETKSMPVMLVK